MRRRGGGGGDGAIFGGYGVQGGLGWVPNMGGGVFLKFLSIFFYRRHDFIPFRELLAKE